MKCAAVDPGTLPGTEERGMLRESMRGFLQAHWPAARAVASATASATRACMVSSVCEASSARLVLRFSSCARQE